jgi:hypothetical protein
MTDDKYRAPEVHSLQGRVFRPLNEHELAEAIEAAFDYRGDVTLELRDGTRLDGYIANRDAAAQPPFIELFTQDSSTRVISYTDIIGISFTGIDTASGKSWEAWMNKKGTQRRAEVERVIAEAQARGHL